MKRRIILCAILTAFAMLSCSCGGTAPAPAATQTEQSSTEVQTAGPAEAQTTESETTTAPVTEEPVTTTIDETPVFTGGYETIEQEFYRDGKKIAGKLFMPNGSGRFPVVILGHGFGANMSNVEPYGKALVNEGIAAYIFDFIGGGNDIQSDGEMVEMSVLTEAADLNVIIDGISELDGIDSGKMFLVGESQGGLVSTYVAATRPDDIKGLVGLYPAYSIAADSKNRAADYDELPETMNVMGKTLGKIYTIDAMSFDIYEMMPDYDKKVLLIHGEADNLVPLAVSERAANTFANAELVTIERAGHGFSGKGLKEAKALVVDFIKSLI